MQDLYCSYPGSLSPPEKSEEAKHQHEMETNPEEVGQKSPDIALPDPEIEPNAYESGEGGEEDPKTSDIASRDEPSPIERERGEKQSAGRTPDKLGGNNGKSTLPSPENPEKPSSERL